MPDEKDKFQFQDDLEAFFSKKDVQNRAIELYALKRSIEELNKTVTQLQTDVGGIKKQLDDLNGLFNKGRGALFLILTVGGFVGWMLTLFHDYIGKWLTHA